MVIHFTNPQYQDLVKGFDNRMAALGQAWLLIRTGQLFHGIPTEMPPIDPTLELGSDWRELFTLEVKRTFAPDIKSGDIILQADPASNTDQFQKFPLAKAVRKEDNPANSIAVKFWFTKIPDSEADTAYEQLGTTQEEALAIAQP